MTTASPAPDRLTWIGHATVVADLAGTRLITDPLLRGRLIHLRRHAPPPRRAAIRRPDAILISHLHYDHLDVPSLRLLGRRTPIVAPRGAGAMLARRGFRDVTEVVPGDRFPVGGIEVLAVPAEHDATRRPGGPVAQPLGFVLLADGLRVYFAGDTGLFDGMATIGAAGLDVALLPIWGWGTKLGPGHLDPVDAARAAALLRPAVAIPIHWGTFFPRGLAGLRGALLVEPPRRFVAEMARVAPSVDVHVLAPGGSFALARDRRSGRGQGAHPAHVLPPPAGG